MLATDKTTKLVIDYEDRSKSLVPVHAMLAEYRVLRFRTPVFCLHFLLKVD